MSYSIIDNIYNLKYLRKKKITITTTLLITVTICSHYAELKLKYTYTYFEFRVQNTLGNGFLNLMLHYMSFKI